MILTASQKLPLVYQPGMLPGMPWVNSEVFIASVNAGVAGKLNHAALDRSKSTGIRV